MLRDGELHEEDCQKSMVAHPRMIFVNGDLIVFIVKQLVEDGGRLSAVLISEARPVFTDNPLLLELRNASHNKRRSRQEYVHRVRTSLSII